MSYIAPSTRTTGTLISAAIWNQDVVDNVIAVAAHAHTGAAGDGSQVLGSVTLPPKIIPLTTTQRNALTPVAGMIIYNSTTGQFEKYENGAWTGSATYAVAAKGVTNGDSHDHVGGDGAQINHTGLSNIGTNTHAQVDTAVANSVSHIASAHVTGGDSHDHVGGDGAQVNHTGLSNIGTNTHAQVDTAIANSVSHIAASAAVHGLGASVNVLGNRNAAGEFVERGTDTGGTVNSAMTIAEFSNDKAVTFPVAFASAPVVVATCTDERRAFVCVLSVSTTGFTYVVCAPSGLSGSRQIRWIALGL